MSFARHVAALTTLALSSFALPAAADEAAPAPPAPPPVSAAAPPPAPEARRVEVELQSNDSRATIERRVGTTSLAGLPFVDGSFAGVGLWQEECVAPCEVKLDPRYSYRVAGEGVTPSESFALPKGRDKVHISAEMGSSRWRLAGILTTGLGAGTAAVGATALALTPVFENNDVGSKGFRQAVLVGGIVALAAGVLELGAGLYMWQTNGTSVRSDHGTLGTRRAASAGPRLTATGLAF
jgi:hypothetical protein